MAFDRTTLDRDFASLAAFDWGADAEPLTRIDAAVVACHGDASLAADLERRLLIVVRGAASRAAKEYACRKLSLIGTATAVPGLTPLLADPAESHMARFALERIPVPAAAEALRAAVGTVPGELVIGMISSLANRRDEASVETLAKVLDGDDDAAAAAAAAALGRIGTAKAAAALAAAKARSASVADAVIDARIASADALLAAGDREGARTIYEAIAAGLPAAPRTLRERAIRIATTSGVLACLDDTSKP